MDCTEAPRGGEGGMVRDQLYCVREARGQLTCVMYERGEPLLSPGGPVFWTGVNFVGMIAETLHAHVRIFA